MDNIFTGTSIAHSILLFAAVIGGGLYLGRFKIKGISIGTTWILFVGIILSHFGLRSDPTVLSFMKDFGLILFVFSIGLQVGPGFFASFKKGGVKLNLLAMLLISLAVVVTIGLHFATSLDLFTLTGVMSGAVTNTPGLGAAQQTLAGAENAQEVSSVMASAYAVTYPIGAMGVIFVLMLFKSIFKIDLTKEKQQLDEALDTGETARRMHCEVSNPAVFGKTLAEVTANMGDDFVASRLLHNGEISIPGPETVLHEGDRLLLVTDHKDVDTVRIIFGKEVPMHQQDWQKMDSVLVSRRLSITKSAITGKHLAQLGFRSNYNVTVTRVIRSGIELVARPGLILQVGDSIQVVGTEENISLVAKIVGNKPETLTHPNLVPIFFGIAVGVLFGCMPIKIPGIPQAIRLGLAGGPLLIAILLGHFGPKLKITTYTTVSANMMIREIGISFFMAAVGLDAGKTFVSSIVGGGYWWILYGALITMVPVSLIIIISRLVFKLNFYEICGLAAGGTTDAVALSFAQSEYGTDYTSVYYATVYPLTMFLRVLIAQLFIIAAL